jgi:hypothetical protein
MRFDDPTPVCPAIRGIGRIERRTRHQTNRRNLATQSGDGVVEPVFTIQMDNVRGPKEPCEAGNRIRCPRRRTAKNRWPLRPEYLVSRPFGYNSLATPKNIVPILALDDLGWVVNAKIASQRLACPYGARQKQEHRAAATPSPPRQRPQCASAIFVQRIEQIE